LLLLLLLLLATDLKLTPFGAAIAAATTAQLGGCSLIKNLVVKVSFSSRSLSFHQLPSFPPSLDFFCFLRQIFHS